MGWRGGAASVAACLGAWRGALSCYFPPSFFCLWRGVRHAASDLSIDPETGLTVADAIDLVRRTFE